MIESHADEEELSQIISETEKLKDNANENNLLSLKDHVKASEKETYIEVEDVMYNSSPTSDNRGDQNSKDSGFVFNVKQDSMPANTNLMVRSTDNLLTYDKDQRHI